MTIEELRASVMRLMKEQGSDIAKEVLATFKVNRLSDLSPNDYEAVNAAMLAKLARGEPAASFEAITAAFKEIKQQVVDKFGWARCGAEGDYCIQPDKCSIDKVCLGAPKRQFAAMQAHLKAQRERDEAEAKAKPKVEPLTPHQAAELAYSFGCDRSAGVPEWAMAAILEASRHGG